MRVSFMSWNYSEKGEKNALCKYAKWLIVSFLEFDATMEGM